MKNLILIILSLVLVACNGTKDGKLSENNNLKFISFQVGTQNFYGHYTADIAEKLTADEYFRFRNLVPLYERAGHYENFNADTFYNAVMTSPESVYRCHDHGPDNTIDLECRIGIW